MLFVIVSIEDIQMIRVLVATKLPITEAKMQTKIGKRNQENN